MRFTPLFYLALLCGCAAKPLTVSSAHTVLPLAHQNAVKLFVSGAEQLEVGTPKALKRARELLLQAVEMDPGLWEGHYDLGLTEQRLGNLESACKSLQKAHELASHASEPTLALAHCKLRQGDADAAANLLDQAVANDPENLEVRLSLSAVNRERNKLPLALAQAREVLVRNPHETRALLEVGRVYRVQKELDVAELVLEKAQSIDAKSAPVHHELGLIALDRGDTQVAFARFETAEKLDPQFTPAHLNKGSVLLKAGDYKAAERAYRAALSVSSDLTEARVGLAIALRAEGKHQEAQKEYESVLRAQPEHLAALFNLAVLKSDFLAQRADALLLFQKYLARAPKSDSHRTTAERYVEDIRMSEGQTP